MKFYIVLVLLVVLPSKLDAGCPGGWSEYKGNCYKKFPGTTWNRARDACANIESTLTEVKDEEENNFIKERFGGNNWLGLSRCHRSSTCLLDDSSALYTNWAAGEPDKRPQHPPGLKNEDFAVVIQADGTWKDQPMLENRPYICKKPAGCPGGWSEYKGNCYKKFPGTTWNRARDACANIESTLTEVKDEEENNFIKERFGGNNWLGLSRCHRSSTCLLDYSSALYTNWAPGEPDKRPQYPPGLKNEDFAVVIQADGTWKDQPMLENRPYICRKPAGCPDGWREYKGSCYKKFPGTTWNRARDACASIESTLTEVKDEEENDFIKERFGGNNWLGLSRCHRSSTCLLDYSSALYTNWAAGEPNKSPQYPPGLKNKDFAVVIQADGTWEDQPMLETRPYICKKPAGCPGGWSEYKGNCYKKFPGTTWNRARDACANIESTLTEVKGEEENDFIKERFGGNNWLGLSRCHRSSTCLLDYSSALYTNWAPGEPYKKLQRPAGLKNKDFAVAIQADGTWTDEPKLETRPYICKKPGGSLN